jgi:hydrogenase-4 component B
VSPALHALAGVVLAAAGLLALRRGRRREVTRPALTWTCGVAPTADMEYTATSYSKLIRLFFRQVLLPQREIHVDYHAGTPLPQTMHYEGEVTHVLEEHLFRPVHRLSVSASSRVRRLQNGSLQVYLAYSLVAFVLLLALAR